MKGKMPEKMSGKKSLTMKKFEGSPLDKKVDMAAIKRVNAQKGAGKKKK
jgi:hypothetical protein